MIKAHLQDQALLADIDRARSDTGNFHLWWLGQSGFLIQWQGRHLLIDPYLSDSLTKKYADTDKPHVRMTDRVVAPEALNFIDVVTSSHNHTDHLDAETLKPLFRVNPELSLVIPEANREFVANRLDIESAAPTGLDARQVVEFAGFKFNAVPAAHEEVERDESGRCRFLGYVIEFGPWTVYHSGDTVLYDGMIEGLRNWNIDLCILPINGSVPERRVAGNLNGTEAASLAREVKSRFVIPCHFDMFEFNTASPDEFSNAARELNQPYRVLHGGERWSSAEISDRV